MIPIRTDRRLEHTPLVNYALIAANVLVFIFLQGGGTKGEAVETFILQPDQPQLHQFITAMFMHAGWWHLIGNMIFLWVFGNAVNDVMGNVGYLAFYLAGGVAASLAYLATWGVSPVLGASGAISAVTGTFLVLFPRVRVTVLLPIFYVLMPLEVSSLFFLLLQFVWNLFSVADTSSGVAYVAHAGGYVFGIALAALLLYVKLLPRDVYDLLSLVRMWRRRLAHRQVVSGGYNPFDRAAGVQAQPRRPWIELEHMPPPAPPSAEPPAPPGESVDRQQQLRRAIATAHGSGDLPTAAKLYLELVQAADDPVLSLAQQLDVANQLMAEGLYSAAADAYERLLRQYGNYPFIGDIRLMLGILYSRYLHQDDRAEGYLTAALPDLVDRRKLELAQAELAAVRQRLGR